MDAALLPEPVSTSNPLFLATVDDHLAKGEVIVVLIRYANSGGAKDYHVIQIRDEFLSLLKDLEPKTSITIFFKNAFPINGLVNNSLIMQIEKLFSKEYDEYEGLNIVCLDSQLNNDESSVLFIQQLNLIFEWLKSHDGFRVMVGTMKFWNDNNKDFITAYVPDGDDQIRLGAY